MDVTEPTTMDMKDGPAAMGYQQLPTDEQWVPKTRSMTAQDEEQEAALMKQTFHQPQMPLNEWPNSKNLWQFPQVDLSVDAKHPIHKLFKKTAGTVRAQWKIDPAQVVPEIMRPYTPYSLSLFLGLRRVVSHTKGNSELGIQHVLSAWHARVGDPSQFHPGGMQVLQTQVDEWLVNPDRCETFIQETNYGLTLQDVRTALSRNKSVKSVEGAANLRPVPGGKLRGQDAAAARAEKTKARKEKKAARKGYRAELEDRLNVFAVDTKVTKVKTRSQRRQMREKVVGPKGDKLLKFLQDTADEDGGVALDGSNQAAAPPNSPEISSSAPSAPCAMRDAKGKKNRFAALTNSDGAAKLPEPPQRGPHRSGEDRHNDNMLSNMFNRVDFEDRETRMHNKRTQKLLARSESRRMTGGGMPSERVKLAEIPTLYAQQGLRRQEEVMEGLGKMGLSAKGEEKVVKTEDVGVDVEEGGVKLEMDDEEL